MRKHSKSRRIDPVLLGVVFQNIFKRKTEVNDLSGFEDISDDDCFFNPPFANFTTWSAYKTWFHYRR